MDNSAEILYQTIHNITDICYKKDVHFAVLSPGSRSAPLALSFIRNKNIKHFIINDERSAGYFALGLAQQTKKTVVLVCTSGTAALNYAPAVAEAYFQKIPLLIFTADRPPESIEQQGNQTIHQYKLYEPNVLKSFQLNISYNDKNAEDEAYRIVSESINISQYPQKGAVHINVPMREPLYLKNIPQRQDQNPKVIDLLKPDLKIPRATQKKLIEKLITHKKILVVAGVFEHNTTFKKIIDKLLAITDICFVRDITSNIPDLKHAIIHHEELLTNYEGNISDIQPDLLITFGGQIVSKPLRIFLQENKAKEHWHIDATAKSPDTFQSITKTIAIHPEEFFRILLKNIKLFKTKSFHGFYKKWEKLDDNAIKNVEQKISSDDELYFISEILKKIPKNSILQLGNGSIVRQASYLSFIKNKFAKSIEVYSNRGTSGIDGCLSTAIGSAVSTDKIVTLIIGDLSFFYDRNAFWNKYLPKNLKLIVINNHGGGIFRKMQGPQSQPELDEYFTTPHKLSIKKITEQYEIEYFKCTKPSKIKKSLSDFYNYNKKTTVLEIDIDDVK
ncbi:MAG: 2-succinyl-5-enolpyruvyl-6-hydroxy-3-cyclohexene-1-carboxylic-acid synthase [Bacteroidota bacterium]|nr:2-succinyl-5-enolpyruvyl-6-hydroxy-3-cyclohexene-1-carboxylic-acid synthase [Bacteroidota bacterium]